MNDHARTLYIIKKLSEGETITIPNVGTIAMAEDMTIGFIAKDAVGNEFVLGLSTMDLCQLNKLLNQHEIGMIKAGMII